MAHFLRVAINFMHLAHISEFKLNSPRRSVFAIPMTEVATIGDVENLEKDADLMRYDYLIRTIVERKGRLLEAKKSAEPCKMIDSEIERYNSEIETLKRERIGLISQLCDTFINH